MVATPLPNPATRIIEEPTGTILGAMPMVGTTANLVISVATSADTIIPWGLSPRQRDLQLRAFWPTEHYFAGALFDIVSQYIAFGWSLSGPPRTLGITQEILNNVQMGRGWEALMTPYLIDYFTTDNGAFMEIVRTDDSPSAPVVSLNHLDSYRCLRTGKHEEPVIYVDLHGGYHRLKWYQVIADSEFPSPIEEARGIGYCALSRVLRAAQIMRDVSVVQQEKAAGRFTRQVHLVGGVQTQIIENAIKQKQSEADGMGYMRYIQPLIVASLDPTARVSLETIDLASIPMDFDPVKAMQVYLTVLAMSFGTDYQTFAPLPGGGLGSASQSKVLNMKSRGKGAALFMRKIERLFNFHGIVPRTITFTFGEQDVAQQMEQTEVRKARAEMREIRIRSGEITTEVARQMAVDDGDLDERYLLMMREENATDDVTAGSVEPVRIVKPGDVKPGEPGPKEPPKAAAGGGAGGAVDRPANSNDKRNRNPAANQKRNPGGTPDGGARA